MGKRHYWTVLAGMVSGIGLSISPVLAAPPEPLPAGMLDWQAWGEDVPPDALCRGRYVMPEYRLPPGDVPAQVRAVSDTASYGADGETILGGEVILRRNDSQLEAPQVRVNAERDRAFASGPLALRDQGLLVRGDDAEVSLESDAAQVDTAHYVVHDHRLRGDAQRLQRLEDGRYRLTEASFTTCEPGDDLWRLVSNDIVLDRESGFGTARHARLEVSRVPVFYWPWVRFPIDDRRQTGFLWPALGLSSDSFDYAQPYYLNLAPNYDATITPRWLTEHGLLLGGEFRYLFPSDAGTFEGAFLSSDKGGSDRDPDVSSRRFEGEDRWYVDYQHVGRFSPRLRYNLRYGSASDGRYFDDFGRSFGERETNNLLRLARLDYRGSLWQLEARAQGFQKLEEPLLDRNKPFYRLPSLTANARWRQDNGFYQQWRSNATYFWRDVDETRVPLRESAVGGRLHLSPAVGWRAEPSWGFLEPRVEMLHTAYELDYGERQTDFDTTPSRTVPVSTVDAGLIFERELDIRGEGYLQTLEPRLNYAYVPTRDQSEFPDFDTDERAFSWNQLWSPYRFTGSDRVGDLNRLSYAATTRFLEDDTGRQRFSLGVGQAVFFDDRTIDIAGDPDTLPPERNFERFYQATRERSPVVTRLDWQVTDRWSTRYEWLYDDDLSRTERSSVGLRYRDPRGHVLNLGYRWELQGFDPSGDAEDRLGFNREDYDVSFAYRLNPRVDMIGRFLYDNTNDRALDQLAGVQWNDCCYGVQLVWREWIEDNDTANTIEDDFTDRGIFLRFVFKGLGGVGQGADTYFEEAIPGYRATAF
ncbi:LPS-assembly protein LptD [Litchfieldella qijiaojingensis]|uniref:LPS-assembly protein LptD n=1 Tax=Litchfieldella qijiaojingensis TaxID=980347 RepID=A0ABQ2Z1K0_9GAMM|nr:LPS assembly protein LptD [Halomonas qijiaojingensis]GGY00164.1 LPS-assembly protein LptD [Halomonas qijiaojingensis]